MKSGLEREISRTPGDWSFMVKNLVLNSKKTRL